MAGQRPLRRAALRLTMARLSPAELGRRAAAQQNRDGGKFVPGPVQANEDIGKPPQLKWIELESLRIDPRYQRQITDDGRSRINRIVREFRWSRFHPLMVTPI